MAVNAAVRVICKILKYKSCTIKASESFSKDNNVKGSDRSGHLTLNSLAIRKCFLRIQRSITGTLSSLRKRSRKVNFLLNQIFGQWPVFNYHVQYRYAAILLSDIKILYLICSFSPQTLDCYCIEWQEVWSEMSRLVCSPMYGSWCNKALCLHRTVVRYFISFYLNRYCR